MVPHCTSAYRDYLSSHSGVKIVSYLFRVDSCAHLINLASIVDVLEGVYDLIGVVCHMGNLSGVSYRSVNQLRFIFSPKYII